MAEGLVCVECGAPVSALYRPIGSSVRLENCASCGAVADPYVECDYTVPLLGLLLHKPRAYRHLLVNTRSDRRLALGVLVGLALSLLAVGPRRSLACAAYALAVAALWGDRGGWLARGRALLVASVPHCLLAASLAWGHSMLMTATVAASVVAGHFFTLTDPATGLTVFNTACKTGSSVVSLCRGLVLHIPSKTVVARPFPPMESKFASDDIVEATPKIDGSLGIMFLWRGDIHVFTRKRANSEQAVWATAWAREHMGREALEEGWTYLVEIVSGDNTVCIDYPFEGLVLLSAMSPEGTDMSSSRKALTSWGFPVVMKLVQKELPGLDERTHQQNRAELHTSGDSEASTAHQRLLLLKGRLGLATGIASDPPLRCVLPMFFELEDIPDILAANIGPHSMAIGGDQSIQSTIKQSYWLSARKVVGLLATLLSKAGLPARKWGEFMNFFPKCNSQLTDALCDPPLVIFPVAASEPQISAVILTGPPGAGEKLVKVVLEHAVFGAPRSVLILDGCAKTAQDVSRLVGLLNSLHVEIECAIAVKLLNAYHPGSLRWSSWRYCGRAQQPQWAYELARATSLASAICSIMQLVQKKLLGLDERTDQQSRAELHASGDSTAHQRLLLLKGRLGLETGIASEVDSRTVFLPRLRPGKSTLADTICQFLKGYRTFSTGKWLEIRKMKTAFLKGSAWLKDLQPEEVAYKGRRPRQVSSW
eukprot:m51a1_g12307 hypothetical protein (709) ;mRNA; r:368761-382107